MKERKIELSVDNRKEVIVLPINPQEVEWKGEQLNQKITLLNVGEALLTGNRGLLSTSLSSFFPSKKSPFYKYAKKPPKKYIAQLMKWKNNNKIVRLIIPDAGINLAMAIDTLTYTLHEGDADIYYTLNLTEYRKLNVSSVKTKSKVKANGLKERPDVRVKGKTHTVKKGETLWGIAKKYYGSGAQYQKIYRANQDKVKNPDRIYMGQKLMIP